MTWKLKTCFCDFSIESLAHYTFVLDALLRKGIVQPSELGASVSGSGDAVLQSVKVRTGKSGYRTILRILVERYTRGKGLTLK